MQDLALGTAASAVRLMLMQDLALGTAASAVRLMLMQDLALEPRLAPCG
ncbi:hypothetical protein TBK1r_39020 [Stieleria magnilauensis]|uniref:Uncharacterized protein n=1 Tax=Stieleria magnilauensis TaxID=2527963 RepID=A0ABX5XSS4_9BACT|nr:hypothetical protein TBK1r_39010 [Planctomycetes bacterium TBK1r]QDV84950.1 hypothetical protein TBK1r_39020 [Planctomycetes bacterium TBK1r]